MLNIRKLQAGHTRLFLLAALPVSIAVVQGVTTFQEMKESWLVENQPQLVVHNIDVAYQTLSYPEFGQLQISQPFPMRISAETQPSPLKVAIDSEPAQNPVTVTSRAEHADLFSGLDLSVLSPEMALRLKSAFSDSIDSSDSHQGEGSRALTDTQAISTLLIPNTDDSVTESAEAIDGVTEGKRLKTRQIRLDSAHD